MKYRSFAVYMFAASLLVAASACGASAFTGTGKSEETLTYGTDEYFESRISMYNDSDMMYPQHTMTRDHLPWDPNGPKIPVNELKSRLDTLVGGVFPGDVDQQVAGICANDPGFVGYEYEAGRYVDKAIGNLRLGGALALRDPSVLVDASGGFDCGNGKTATGSGQPIFSQLQTDTSDRWTFDVRTDDHT